jgi:23S rRNA (pseudouridine1915-N3)-methyltransferase
MRIALICVGRLKLGPEKDLFDRYLSRFNAISRSCGIQGLDLREIDESRARRAQDRLSDESRAIELAVPQGAICTVFDERGTFLNSDDFTTSLSRLRDAAVPAAFIVGGPDGVAERWRSSAAQLVGFGAMTLPHQLVRILVAEQLYRAATRLSGHPYHRG